MKVTTYTPSRSASEAFSLPKMFRDLLDAQFLGRQLFVRDKRAMFRQSFLGILWAFIPPFFTAAAWVFLNMTGAVNIGDTGVPYPVYVFCGTILFQTFLESLNAPAGAVNAGKGMLAKLNFPREALLLNAFYTLLFNLAFKLIALVIIALALRFHFGWSLLLFPLGVLGSILMGFSIGVFLIPFQMLYSDFGRMIAIGGQVLMYLTPVVYPMPSSGVLHYINRFNPITYIITVPRAWFTGQEIASVWPFLLVVGCSLVILFLGWVLYPDHDANHY
jgi:lipopolysaccharide transport system permease protein